MTGLVASNPSGWEGRRVFLTGHTGFKGSWLALWLQSMGADVFGFALAAPTEPSLFEAARISNGMHSTIGDIRDAGALRLAMQAARPDVVLHLAAQSLVRLSYTEPVATYATNVMGTVHLLEAVRTCPSVRAVVNVTTDKCYENREWVWGYREDEPMGGFDPYSNSKGCSELVTSAYRRSFLQQNGVAVASARAGNVIGGGDWAADRLVPDVLRAWERGDAVVVRNPRSTRPWQHVLEPLSGYLLLAEQLLAGRPDVAEAFNFGPREDDTQPVQWVVERLAESWRGQARWLREESRQPHEAHSLKLDISKARHRLGWEPRWSLAQALDSILAWHRSWLAGADVRELSLAQISEFVSTAPRHLP